MNNRMWIAIAVGAGIGVAVVLGVRNNKRSRWDRWDTRDLAKKFNNQKDDLLVRGRDLMESIRVICEEGKKVVDEAGELWHEGRKLVKA
jgi:hypothetical protein